MSSIASYQSQRRSFVWVIVFAKLAIYVAPLTVFMAMLIIVPYLGPSEQVYSKESSYVSHDIARIRVRWRSVVLILWSGSGQVLSFHPYIYPGVRPKIFQDGGGVSKKRSPRMSDVPAPAVRMRSYL